MNRVAQTIRAIASRRYTVDFPENVLTSARNYIEAVTRVAPPVSSTRTIIDGVDPAAGFDETLISPEMLDAMIDRLWLTLPFSKLRRDSVELVYLLRTYVKSLETLRKESAEMRVFFNNATFVMIEMRWGKTEEVVNRSVAALRGDLNFEPLLPASLVTADLTTQNIEVIRERLEHDLRRKASLIVRHFAALLRTGVQRNWFGLITWLNQSTCRFTHCIAPIIEMGHERRRERGSDGIMQTRTVYAYQHRLGVREHHLIHARLATGIPNQRHIPSKLHILMDAIPNFVRPFIATVDGLLIRERAVEWDLFESQTVEIEPVPDRLPDWDPAIVLGPVVLTAWTERDFRPAYTKLDKLRRFLRRLCRPTSRLS